MRAFQCLLALCFAFLWTAPAVAAEPAQASRYDFVAHPCASEDPLPGAICGSVAVPENYAKPSGRTIELNVVLFRATEMNSEKAAQFDLEGGPGFAVTESAGFYATDGVAYHEHRDVVLVDMRGTGASNPLRCPSIEARTRTEPAAAFYPPDLVEDCARSLATSADLTQYGTASASRDLDAVRAALGYERVDLNALSYGTTLALRYIADYPERVRSAVLTGTVPADQTPPAHHAIAAERGLKLLFDACAADKSCAAQYPHLHDDLETTIEQLGQERSAIFLEKVRTQMYLPVTARAVPKIVHDAARGNVEFLTKPGAGRVFADGLYLAITCSESIARMDVDAAIAESDATPFSAYRLRRQRDACAHWPMAPADPDLFRKGTYNVPVLFLSGALDPVTPPAWTAEVAKMFPKGRQIVFPEGGHVLEGLSGLDTCMDAMILKFVATLSASEVDTACVAGMSRGGFVLAD